MKCPSCGIELPILSKVCPECGHVMNGDNGETLKAAEYMSLLGSKLSSIKKIPTLTFGQSFKNAQVFLCPAFSIACVIFALITDAGLFWIASALFLILFIVFLIIKLTSKSFSKKKVEFEELMNTTRRYFGDDREVHKELDVFVEEFDSIERTRKANSRRNTIIWIVIAAVILIALSAIVFLVM